MRNIKRQIIFIALYIYNKSILYKTYSKLLLTYLKNFYYRGAVDKEHYFNQHSPSIYEKWRLIASQRVKKGYTDLKS